MSTINVKDAAAATVAVQLPNANGQGTMATSRPVVIASDQTSVPVSIAGTVTVSNPTAGGLTDTQLRASAVPVSGTITANLGTLNGAATAAAQSSILTAIGSPFQAGGNIGNISGTISLPTGAATAANQTSELTKLDQLHTDMIAATPAGTNTIGSVKLTDGTNTATVKAASTAAVAADTAAVIQLSPNQPNLTTALNVNTYGMFNTTLPTLSNGTIATNQLTNKGELIVQLSNGGNPTTAGATNADNAVVSGNSGAGLTTRAFAYVFNGTGWDRTRGDANGLAIQPALSSTFWNYAAATGGIVNSTTGVTVKTAAGAGVRNYIKSLQLTADTLGAATEFVIRDGAAGTVLARIKINTAGLTASGTTIFDPPLRGTANTLVEIATLTASVTGGVFANIQGYTGV